MLKLDEAEVVEGKKFERISLTLMNRALDPEIQKNDAKYFSVQSEQEIWPIGCFQVAKESYDVLSWAFSKTKFPEVIEKQSSGTKLEVPGVGRFAVEWHLSADMKTIKCMNGLQHGPTCRMNCIYCEQVRETLKACSSAEADRVFAARGKGRWQGGLFAPRILPEPCDINTHPRWKPILPIPLERTHICTLHALNRIVEKILHLHFDFIWNMEDGLRKTEATAAIERSLSAVGIDGCNFQLKQDKKKSGKSGNVVMKPSISGSVASKLFRPSKWSTYDRVWKEVCNAEGNNQQAGGGRAKRWRVWETLEDLQPYLTGLVLTDDQRAGCRAKMDAFGKAFVAAFGETHVTHYIVRVSNHSTVIFVLLLSYKM